MEPSRHRWEASTTPAGASDDRRDLRTLLGIREPKVRPARATRLPTTTCVVLDTRPDRGRLGDGSTAVPPAQRGWLCSGPGLPKQVLHHCCMSMQCTEGGGQQLMNDTPEY